LQSKSQEVLQRERARIARDIHDDVGSGLTELVLQGEVAQTEFAESSPARGHFIQLCDKARSVSHALEEVVWAVNSRRDTLRDFASYTCKYALAFFGSSSIRCRLDVEPEMPEMQFELAVRRNLFLAVKEALNNVARHSEATEVHLRIRREGATLVVLIEDDGNGFAMDGADIAGNGLTNMRERLREAGGICRVDSRSDAGCRVEFRISMASGRGASQHWWQRKVKVEPGAGTEGAKKCAAPATGTTQSQA
jgi:signal transduction histidine kinase